MDSVGDVTGDEGGNLLHAGDSGYDRLVSECYLVLLSVCEGKTGSENNWRRLDIKHPVLKHRITGC